VSNYEVEYSYAGDCNRISQGNIVRTTGGTNSTYNITGLQGGYLNYSITLVAANGTGRGPPYTDYARTRSTGVYGAECMVVVVVYVNA
jgi:hypothetical protein